MPTKPAPLETMKIQAVARKASAEVLALFPSLNFSDPGLSRDDRAKAVLRLAVLHALLVLGATSAGRLEKAFEVSRSKMAHALKKLLVSGLIAPEKRGKITRFAITTKGLMAAISFADFREFNRLRLLLSDSKRKNDNLAYALLVVGYCSPARADAVYSCLVEFAKKGHNVEQLPSDAAAESLLNFYREVLKAEDKVPPNYLGVFREFTTTGFLEVFRLLLSAVKPTLEDYNWLVQFFNEVADFQFHPARVAYLNILAVSPDFKVRLENFKKSQDQQIKREGGKMEVTFIVPGAGLQGISAMPTHLRAIGMRLMLEPLQFINSELCRFFWGN